MESIVEKGQAPACPRRRGRPIKHITEEDRKRAITKSKTKYMLNKSWVCDVCNYDYKLTGKTHHLRTKKHKMRVLNNTNHKNNSQRL